MKTYISILRGINVGGYKSLKMDDLKKLYSDLDFKNVRTYIQSGNAIFQYYETEKQELEEKITDQIQKKFGFDVPVIVLDKEELKEIINNNPFEKDQSKDIAFQSIIFLSATPQRYSIEAIRLKQMQSEEFEITEKAIYLYCPKGFATTKLTNTFFEKQLNVKATTRNWKTSNKLLSMTE